METGRKIQHCTKQKNDDLQKKEEVISLESYRFLEEVLYSFASRKDIKKIAHNLLHHFGNSIINIFNAPVGELMRVQGIKYDAAFHISSIPEIARKYNIEMVRKSEKIVPFEKIEEFLVAYYSTFTVETVALLCLNSRRELLSEHEIYRGSVNSANVNFRKIIELAFSQNASSAILAHNHPSGCPLPSYEDITTTKQMWALMNELDLELVEHYVVAEGKCYSIMDHIKIKRSF